METDPVSCALVVESRLADGVPLEHLPITPQTLHKRSRPNGRLSSSSDIADELQRSPTKRCGKATPAENRTRSESSDDDDEDVIFPHPDPPSNFNSFATASTTLRQLKDDSSSDSDLYSIQRKNSTETEPDESVQLRSPFANIGTPRRPQTNKTVDPRSISRLGPGDDAEPVRVAMKNTFARDEREVINLDEDDSSADVSTDEDKPLFRSQGRADTLAPSPTTPERRSRRKSSKPVNYNIKETFDGLLGHDHIVENLAKAEDQNEEMEPDFEPDQEPSQDTAAETPVPAPLGSVRRGGKRGARGARAKGKERENGEQISPVPINVSVVPIEDRMKLQQTTLAALWKKGHHERA